MYCPSCNTPNPVYNNYCGKCHLALDGSGSYEPGYSPEAIAARQAEQEALQKQNGQSPQEVLNLAYVEKKHALEQRHKSGSGWFFWIAGMSAVNSILLISGSTTRFVTGLGITTFFEAVAMEMNKSGTSGAGLAKGFAFFIDITSVCLFIIFGIFSKRKKSWAYLTGIILYSLDTLILLLFQDWMSIAFHVWAVISLIGGFRALRALNRLEPPKLSDTELALGQQNLESDQVGA